MVNSRIVKRYALALMKSADAVSIEQIRADIITVERIVGSSKDLKVLLRSPVIEYYRKQGVFREVFGHIISPATLDFIMLLLSKKREIMFKEIIAAFKQLYNERNNIQSVKVESAITLDETAKSSIIAAIETKIGKKTEAAFIVNPALRGGICITIGDLTYDGSIRRQLELIYKQMTGEDMPEQLQSRLLN